MKQARKLAVTAAVLLVATSVGAGGGEAADLRSDPAAGHLVLKGAVTIAGVTPIPLEDILPGRYQLVLEGAGMGRHQGGFTRFRDGRLEITRFAGPLAALLPPGLTHLQRGERARGWLFLGAGSVFATAAAINEVQRGDAADDLDAAQRRYDEAVAGGAVREARLDLLQASERADDASEVRDLWVMYTGAVWVGAAVEAVLLTPRPGLRGDQASGYTMRGGGASGIGAALRSMLVPGAGQRYLGQEARGNRFTFGVALMAGGALVAHEAFLQKARDQADAQRRYDLADTGREAARLRSVLDSAADDARNRERLRLGLMGAAAAIYLWNIFDAVSLSGEVASPASISLRMEPDRDGMRAGLVWRID